MSTATFTSEDLRRLGEARELIKAIASLTSKPGTNKTVAALNEFLKLSNTKLSELHDELSRRMKESA